MWMPPRMMQQMHMPLESYRGPGKKLYGHSAEAGRSVLRDGCGGHFEGAMAKPRDACAGEPGYRARGTETLRHSVVVSERARSSFRISVSLSVAGQFALRLLRGAWLQLLRHDHSGTGFILDTGADSTDFPRRAWASLDPFRRMGHRAG